MRQAKKVTTLLIIISTRYCTHRIGMGSDGYLVVCVCGIIICRLEECCVCERQGQRV